MIKLNQCYTTGVKDYRLIYANESENIVALIRLSKKSAMPTTIRYDDFLKDVENKIFKQIKDPSNKNKLFLEERLSEKEKQKRDKNYEMIINAWLQRKEELLNKKKRNKVFVEIAKENELHVRTVERVFSRYWQRGMNKNALLPDFRLSGWRNKSKNPRIKNGRKYKRKIKGHVIVGKILTPDDINFIKIAYFKHYRQRHEPTLSSSYWWMLGEYYKDKVTVNDNGEEIFDPERTPSINQFYNEVKKMRNKYEDIVARRGQNYYDKNYRHHLIGLFENGLRIYSEIEIDSTIADIEIVNFVTRKPIGRPIIYAAVDKLSRMTVGVYVGLEHDSWSGYSMLLNNMITDKVEYCKSLGINIDDTTWPSKDYLPARILSDNGAFVSEKSGDLITNFQIELLNAGSYRADHKGLIERHWRYYNDYFRNENIPGAVFKDTKERGGRPDSKEAACLTLQDVTKIVVYLTIQRNNSLLEKVEIPYEMASAGVNAVPIEMWDWGIKEYGIPESVFDKEFFRLVMLPDDTAIVTQNGIRCGGNRDYICDRYIEENWEVNRLGEEFNCKVDPDSIDVLYILDKKAKPDQDDVVICQLTERYGRYRSLSLDDWLTYRDSKNLKESELKAEKGKKRVDTNRKTKEIVADAQATQKRDSYNHSKQSVREEREKEKEYQKSKNVTDLPKAKDSQLEPEKEFIKERTSKSLNAFD